MAPSRPAASRGPALQGPTPARLPTTPQAPEVLCPSALSLPAGTEVALWPGAVPSAPAAGRLREAGRCAAEGAPPPRLRTQVPRSQGGPADCGRSHDARAQSLSRLQCLRPAHPGRALGAQVRAPQATIAPFMQSRRPVESQIRLCPQEVLSAVSSASPCQACHSTSPHFRRERRAIRFPRPGPRTAPERPSQVAFVSSALGFRGGGDWRETPRRQDPQASARPPLGGCRPQRACVSGRAGSRGAKARFSHPRLR